MPDIVDLVVEDERWLPVGIAALAERAARLALAAAGCVGENWEISLLACDDARIRALNAEHRGKDTATNVLSWPADDLAASREGDLPLKPGPASGPWPVGLGDLAISYDTCLREAQEAGIGIEAHATHLVLHGCLHLLGFDHVRDGDAGLMEGLESKALASIGITDPYS
jgi:probable rRNA maturation factor